MREIKFRAWLGKDKRMVDVYSLTPDAHTGDCQIVECTTDERGAAIHRTHIIKSEWLSQFTGLLDRNGVEIYEGDVVVRKSSISHSSVSIVVEFQDGMFSPFAQEGGLDGNYAWDAKESEVISNIYQNPELLPHNTVEKEAE